MRWILEITGNISLLRNLSNSLASSETCIFQEGNKFFLETDDFYSLPAANDEKYAANVYFKAKEIVDVINGAVSVTIGTQDNISTANVFKIEDDGTRKEIGIAWAEIELPSFIIKAAGKGAKISNPFDIIKKWIDVAKRDENVEKALRIFTYVGKESSWSRLYLIHEIIRHDVGKNKIENWVGDLWKHFRDSANSFAAIGLESRHAKYDIPGKSMNLSQAKSYIKALFNNWFYLKDEGN